jgi:transcriptional regulator of arginine metabolism
MDKTHRQFAILSLLDEETISTQEQLRRSLTSLGFDVTQATLSRDLKGLGVVKRATENGLYKYAPSPSSRDISVKSCKASGNLIVVKTETGLAAAVAYKIDALGLDSVLGTVAGEDTPLVVLNGKAKSEAVCEELLGRLRNIH